MDRVFILGCAVIWMAISMAVWVFHVDKETSRTIHGAIFAILVGIFFLLLRLTQNNYVEDK